MLEVTSRAREELRDLLLRAQAEGTRKDGGQDDANGGTEPRGFRLITADDEGEPATFSLILDSVRLGDHVFDYKGQKVLIVGRRAAQLLGECVLDVVETGPGSARLQLAPKEEVARS